MLILEVEVPMAKDRVSKLTDVRRDIIFGNFGVESGITMAEGIIQVAINKLKPHHKTELIYGLNEDVSDLITLIEAREKIIRSLIVKENYTIISGHRRWKAAKELGYSTVPCEIASYDSEDAGLADLILHNVDREKTLAQKTREGMTLEATLSSETFLRKLATLKKNRTDMDNSSTSEEMVYNGAEEVVNSEIIDDSEKGLTRDKVT
jgi:hypothetical protein